MKKEKMSTQAIISIIVGLAVSLGIGIPFELPTIVIMLLLFGVFVVVYILLYKIKQSANARNGIDTLSDVEKEKKRQTQEHSFQLAQMLSQESAKERYEINFGLIDACMDMTERTIQGSIARGVQMQSEEAPKKDWALAGGFAAGAAGGLAGAAVAMNAIQENHEATERLHKRGREMVERGKKDLKSVRESRKALKPSNYSGFVFSEIDNDLLEEISFEYHELHNYGTGYIDVVGRFIVNNTDIIFPGSKDKAHIDGSLQVALYDKTGERKIAVGYYCPPGRYGNDRSKTGFEAETKEVTISLKENQGMQLNKNDGFIIQLENPKLWLLKL